MGKLLGLVISWLGLFFSMWAAFAGEHSGISPWTGLIILVVALAIGAAATRGIVRSTRT